MPARLNPDASSSLKMLQLYSLLLFSGRKHTLSSLAERLQCSKTTIERLISEIEVFEQVEYGKDGRERWFQVDRLKKSKTVCMMYENVQQITFCKDIVSHMLPEHFRIELQGTVDKTASMLPDSSLQNLAREPIARSFARGMIDYTPYQSIITLIMQAIPKKRLCDVEYKSPQASTSRTFLIAPMRLLSYQNGMYLECWRIKKEEGQEIVQPMTLAVHRIECLNPLRKKHDFVELPNSSNNNFGLINTNSFKAAVRFDTTVSAYVTERIWSDDQEIEEMPSGEVVLRLTVKSNEEFTSWLLSFGDHAELIEPLEIRTKVYAMLTSAKQLYEQCEQ